MFNLNGLFTQDLSGQATANTVCQIPPFSQNTFSTTLSTVPYFVPYEGPSEDTYCPMYPCPHKDLFRIARQIDALPSIECRYQYVFQIFNIINTERDKVIGRLGKDTVANQIILQSVDDDRRFVRLITLDLDCDLLTLFRDKGDITGLYKVNSVGDA